MPALVYSRPRPGDLQLSLRPFLQPLLAPARGVTAREGAESEEGVSGRLGDLLYADGLYTERHGTIEVTPDGGIVELNVRFSPETTANRDRAEGDQVVPCVNIENVDGISEVFQDELVAPPPGFPEGPESPRGDTPTKYVGRLKRQRKRFIVRRYVRPCDRRRDRQDRIGCGPDLKKNS